MSQQASGGGQAQGQGNSSPKATIQLTADQMKVLEQAFGPQIVQRIREIEVDQIAGYLRAMVHAN